MHEHDANKNIIASIFRSRMLSFVPHVQCKLAPKISEVVTIKSNVKIKIVNDKCHAHYNAVEQ